MKGERTRGAIRGAQFQRALKLMPLLLGLLICLSASAAGTWTPLANSAPGPVNLMLLLSDGTVMAAKNDDDIDGRAWYRLTPDSHGSYVNGTWSALASMNYSRLFYASDVLQDGRVFVAGGEYGSGGATSEVYNPVNNIWTAAPVPPSLINPNNGSPALASGNQGFFDAISETLPDGNVLIAPVGPSTYGGTLIYNPTSNAWVAGPKLVNVGYQDEASWVKLPDQSILTIDPYGTNSERYIPSLNKWIADAKVPVVTYDTNGELGAAFLLPNGNALFLGASGNTALYAPSGNTNAGTWAAGAVIPNAQGPADAPAAMMVNGKILCAVNPVGTYNPPTSFYEYDPVANLFSAVDGPGPVTNLIGSYQGMMLDLPDGTVLFSAMDNQLYDYQPDGSPLPAAQPVITSITTNAYRSYHLIGTLLNGISEGAAYGDDAQMASNYPLIRLTDTNGNVYYARTFNWSSTGVMTGTNPVSTDFSLPAALPGGTYSLVVVANGVASAPASLRFTPDALQISPPAGLVSEGPLNGPFNPSNQVYMLVNSGASNLNWTLANTAVWLSLSPGNGNLSAAGGATNVIASVNSSATNLAIGTYSTTVWFTNLSSGAAQGLQFTLQVESLVQNGGFETGDFTGWTLNGSSQENFVGDVNDYPSYVHSGTYAALLGQIGSLASLSQEVPAVSGESYVLSFWLANPLGGAPNEFRVSCNGNTLYDQVNMGTFGWINMQFLIVANSVATELTFSAQNDSDDFGLDDISLQPYVPSTNPPVIVVEPTGETVYLGGAATLSVAASGAFPLFYQWNFDATNLPSATNATLILSNAAFGQAGTYSVVVSNAFGVTASLAAVLDVLPAPIIVNGGFETGDFSGWTFQGDTNANANFVGDAADWRVYVHSGNYAGLFGQNGSLAHLSQTVPTAPGQTYLLSLWLANPVGGPPNEFQVEWNGRSLFDQQNMPEFSFTNMQFVVTATGSNTVLEFGLRNDPDYFGLDDISLIIIPQFQAATRAGGSVVLTWSAITGATYQVQFTSDVNSSDWTNFGPPVVAAAGTITETDSATNSERFYRVVELIAPADE